MKTFSHNKVKIKQNGTFVDLPCINGDDAPQIDDTTPSTEHPYSSAKVEEIIDDIENDISQLNQAKLDKNQGTQYAGKVLGIGSDGIVTPVTCGGGGGAVEDVKVNGASVVDSDGVANIPYGTTSNFGVVKYNGNRGIIQVDGEPTINEAVDTNIQNRTQYRPITSQNIDKAVKAAMCDGQGAAWTSTEQQAARNRIFTVPTTITIAAASWSSQSVTVSVTGVTATGTIMLTPSTKADADTIGSCGIWCTTQADGALTFTCTTTPTQAVSYNVMLF